MGEASVFSSKKMLEKLGKHYLIVTFSTFNQPASEDIIFTSQG